jgi:peroxiredoxin
MRKTKIAALLLLTAVMGFVFAEVLGPGSQVKDFTLGPGSQVKDFTLKDYTGKEHKLSSYKDKAAIVIIFVATRCPVSNAYNERMAKLATEYSAKNVVFLGINSNKQEDAQEVRKHAKENGLNFTILKDPNNVIADAFGATVTPEVFLLSKGLKVAYHGRIDDSQRPAHVKKHDLRKALDEFLAGKAVSETDTKAFGCSIKRVK